MRHKWESSALRQSILEQAWALCRTENARLLYLVFFGSALYGTDTPASDIDVRGIFAPDIDHLYLGKASNSLHYSTGDSEGRNTADDVDIDLWSVKHWLLDLLRGGDTGAVDMLFSHTHAACVMYKHPSMEDIFKGACRLISGSICEGAAKYALRQAKKYGIKGSRLGLLRRIRAFLDALPPDGRLREIMPALQDQFEGEPFFEMDKGEVIIGGKVHIASIRTEEFRRRLDLELEQYGKRAEDALKNKCVDFKALSHALRATGQVEELLRTGSIHYPLAFREKLIEVKSAKIPWTEVEPMFLDGIDRIHDLNKQGGMAWDQDFAELCVTQVSKC